MYSSQQKYGDTQLTLYKKKISAGEQVTILTTYPHPYLGLNYPVIITLNNMNNSTTKINHQNKHFTVLPIYVWQSYTYIDPWFTYTVHHLSHHVTVDAKTLS